MGIFDSVLKKKKTAKYVIDKEDDQKRFLKSDEEMKKAPEKKSVKKNDSSKSEIKAAKAPEKSAGKASAKSSSGTAKNAKFETKVKADTQKTKKEAASPKVAKPQTKPAAMKPAKGEDIEIDLTKTVAVSEGKETRSGKFDVRRGKDGRFFFCLYASNHAPIAYSQMYSSASMAMNGIKSIIANAGTTPTEDTTLKNPTSLPFPKWEIYIDKAGEYRFRLYATNGLCICHASHGYSTKSGCKGGMDSIKRFSAEAKVDKSYLKGE